jgi:hypothetical protein
MQIAGQSVRCTTAISQFLLQKTLPCCTGHGACVRLVIVEKKVNLLCSGHSKNLTEAFCSLDAFAFCITHSMSTRAMLSMSSQHLEQQLAPQVNGPRQAPVQAVHHEAPLNAPARRVSVPARVPVRPQFHGLRDVQQPQLRAVPLRRRLGFAERVNLRRPKKTTIGIRSNH